MPSAADLSPFDGLGRYVILDYDKIRPFSSFLPGIAGTWGIPLWAFYVNRGQGIASFGLESKDKPILEFQPANKAYQLTPTLGFRTFLKLRKGGDIIFYEPFAPWSPGQSQRHMHIGLNELELVESNDWLGLNIQVLYFILPGEPLAGLVRQLTLKNTGNVSVGLELLDGLPAVVPYGADNGALKHIGRTIEAWMQVENYSQGLPFYRLRASSEDRAEVSSISTGNFALGVNEHQARVERASVIVDPELIFCHDTSLHSPAGFLISPLADLLTEPQAESGKTPCSFFGMETTLKPDKNAVLYSVYGSVNGFENLLREVPRLANPVYLAQKREEAQQLVQSLTETTQTKTAYPLFDAYTRQTFLDNVLRGGWPILLGESPRQHVYHIYSRKHGDLERDYNDFFVAPEFFSHGNGNYRDVNQNRRCDVLLNPRVEAQNIRDFLSLIQLDGYNPLVVRGNTFSLPPQARTFLLKLVNFPEKLAVLLENRFTPGGLLKFIADRQIGLSVSPESFLMQVMARAEAHLEADFGEGFWIDHWTYLLDQIKSYLAIFPERKIDLLFGTDDIPFYQSPAQVRPRRERYVLTEHGPRQYHAVAYTGDPGWKRTRDGEIYTTTVFGKLMLLATIKFGTLDPEGMGVEMEAGKPGWYDALNGLPGLFGSSMPETYELLRLIRFLRRSTAELEEEYQIALPIEFADYLEALVDLTRAESDPFAWWEEANDLREIYRDKVYHEFCGDEIILSTTALDRFLNVFQARLQEGISRAELWAEGEILPTYFRYEVTSYEVLENEGGETRLDAQNRPHIQVKEFQPISLPSFLEGSVRYMKVASGEKQSRTIHEAVKASQLYDQKLNMYKLNTSLESQPHEIGRARAFTPGWLENESIWLHMAYKYLLGLLQAELWEEFWEEAKKMLVCFQSAAQYGRSPLENSSFIVSSAHPDESLHGTGFVARLSGSTAEFVHMWFLMMVGKQPFVLKNGELYLRFRPALPAWLFDTQNQIGFNFLGSIPITYHNPQRIDSWNLLPNLIRLHLPDGDHWDCNNPDIPPPFATMIRNKEMESIDVFFKR